MCDASCHPITIDFAYTPERILSETEKLIAESKQELDNIAKNISSPCWSSVMEALNNEEAKFEKSSLLDFFSHVSDNKTLREASLDASKLLESYSVEKAQHVGVFKAVKALATQVAPNLSLTDEQKYYLNFTLQNFIRNGLDLPEDKLLQLKEIKKEINLLSIEFRNNMLEDTKLEFTADELDGLPPSFFESLNINEQTGKYIVTLQYPDLFPILRKCKVPNTRKLMNIAKLSQCQEKNVPIFEKIIKLRQQETQILGFETPAHYVLDVRMAKDPQTVNSFLDELIDKLEVGLLEEMETLLELKRQECKILDIPFDGIINSWDRPYYQEKLLLEKYSIDDDIVSQYFPLDHVVQNTLEFYQILFNVNFKLIENNADSDIWHPDVKKYHVYESFTDEYLGTFFLDLHPRSGKYTHAAEFGLRNHCIYNNKTQLPIASIVANFTKPTPTKPSLLKYDEVVTWGHELGHVLHVIFSKARYSSISGTNVQRDFVEAPSQALENWFYEPQILKMISSHYETKLPLPDDLIARISNARNVNIAIELRRQLFLAKFDMTMHTLSRDAPVESQKHWHDLNFKITKIEQPQGTNGVATFGHLVDGYQAGYYGYLWSQVYSAEIFKIFKENGILNRNIGMEYRTKILAPGGTKDAMELIESFLGRKPNSDAFLKQIGLL